MNLLELSYNQIVNYLLKKYGPVSGPYFISKECKTKNNKITRTKDGLYVHHIREDKVLLLSKSDIAKSQPFEYQEAKNLVYCNLIEHFILHIKIFEESKGKLSGPGMLIIHEQLEDYFINKHIPAKDNWYYNCINAIKNDENVFMRATDYMDDLLRTFKKV